MKANGAPEKIYLEFYRIGDKKYREWVITPKTNNEPIQYTLTDTFIEKACELLTRMIWKVTYEDLEGDSVEHYDKMEFIEGFKNYLKGE